MNIFKLLSIFVVLAMTINCCLAVDNTTSTCLRQCSSDYPYTSDRPTPCCSCCGSDSCHEIPEFSTCCNATQAFCGCLSARAYCVGFIYGERGTTESTFGTCYDPTKGSCSYSPAPNVWIVCPIGTVACPAYSGYTCCGEGTFCNSTQSSIYPECVANTTSSTTESSQKVPTDSTSDNGDTSNTEIGNTVGVTVDNPTFNSGLESSPSNTVQQSLEITEENLTTSSSVLLTPTTVLVSLAFLISK